MYHMHSIMPASSFYSVRPVVRYNVSIRVVDDDLATVKHGVLHQHHDSITRPTQVSFATSRTVNGRSTRPIQLGSSFALT